MKIHSMVETKQIIRTFEDSKVVVKTANRRRPNFVMPKTKQRQTNNCLKTRIRPATGHPSCNTCYGNKSLSKIVNEEIR